MGLRGLKSKPVFLLETLGETVPCLFQCLETARIPWPVAKSLQFLLPLSVSSDSPVSLPPLIRTILMTLGSPK